MNGERRFCYSLAKELGYVNVDEMLRSITSKQLTEWQAFSKIEAAEMKSSSQSRQSLREMRS